MASRSWHLGLHGHLLFLAALLCTNLVSALSNLDTSEPIVRVSPDTSTQDNFGFSVVAHQVEVPIVGDFDSFVSSTRLIVGAPAGTYPGGLTGLEPRAPETLTGLVYQCPVSAGDCTGVISNVSNVTSNDRRLFDGDPNLQAPTFVPENKTMQLMGAFLASNGDFFMACAPRYITDPIDLSFDLDSRRPVGRCYVSPRNLMGFNVLMPCTGDEDSNPATSNANNQCLAGLSGSFFTTAANEAQVALGVVGGSGFNGEIWYYTAADSMLVGTAESTASSLLASNLYDGYSTTAGFITNNMVEDIITGVPRTGVIIAGSVNIRTQMDLTGESVVTNINGSQIGEYFGYSVATSDLNGDGYDELIVGAPIYSDTTNLLQEIGRVFIYENTGGSLNPVPIILTGRSVARARFGTSITNLEDINDDGYEDIAIGAPYEVNGDNSGVVYIHYGRSSEDGLISTSPDQIIQALDIATTVPDLTSLHTFGYSLFSSVDVDGNEFNDLLIGAYESKAAVLIRSLSVAGISVDMTASTDLVTIDTTSNITGAIFTVTVCASYRGRGLDGRSLNTTVEIYEQVVNNIARLYFGDDPTQNTIVLDFIFSTTGVQTCLDVPVFVKPVDQLKGQVDLLSPLEIGVSFQAIARRRTTSFVDGDLVDLIDYRNIPVLIVNGNDSISVTPSVNCSLDSNMQEVCRPDLIVTLINVTYRDSLSIISPQGQAVVDQVQRIEVFIEYSNVGGDPAFGAAIRFTLPNSLSHLRVDFPVDVPSISCIRNDDSMEYTCVLPNFIPPERRTVIALVWLPEPFDGSEENDTIDLSIELVSNRDMETDTGNNNLIGGPIIIDYAAVSDLLVRRTAFTIRPSTYTGIRPPDDADATELGEEVQLSVDVTNMGPSAASSVTLDIYIPTNDAPGSYYLYLYDLETMETPGTCDRTSINPDNLQVPDNTRRKRSTLFPRQETEVVSLTENRDCSDVTAREFCTNIRCNIPILPVRGSFIVEVSASLDERFFHMQSQGAAFVFVAYANVSSNIDFIEDRTPGNNERATGTYRVARTGVTASPFPVWIPIVCGIVAVFIIIGLFVVLYFVGFFRRKKREDSKEAEGDFAVPPPQVAGGNEKPVNIERPIEPAGDDIGGAEDLQDGSIEKRKVDLDPEETSL